MRRKSLTFKKLNSMKVLTLVFVVALFLSPSVRTLTANTLHTVADIIQPQ